MLRFIQYIFAITIYFALGLAPAISQDDGKTILVLDASGSMWGQIDGKAKITIAQEVVGGLLDGFDPAQQLGLTAYGHRRKGDCSDIESLVSPQSGSLDAIRGAVNAINPKGKTPLSAAVIAAAEELKYTEDKATVILVSDGIETCDFDPCEVGRRLEAAGVDFTAHVVGFDVADIAARAQLQCLAENTGGKFLTASNADELGAALEEVSVAEPEPLPEVILTKTLTIDAKEEETGIIFGKGIRWTLTNKDTGEVIFGSADQDGIEMEFDLGSYHVEALRIEDEATGTLDLVITENSIDEYFVMLPLRDPPATLSAVDTAPMGSTINVDWTGPAGQSDLIQVTAIDAKDTQSSINYRYTQHGTPAELLMPPAAGTYEIRYYYASTRRVIARHEIKITPVTASIEAADTASIGTFIDVGWTGPNYQNDYLSITHLGSDDGHAINYSYTRHGSPAELQIPSDPGEYELRYVMSQDKTVLFTKRINVVESMASLDSPPAAIAGDKITFGWSGPDTKNDYISVAAADADDSKYEHYAYTRAGSPIELQMPAVPGDYEVRYVMGQGRKIMARQAIRVTDVGATLTSAPIAAVGESLEVTWNGPGYPNDFIALAEVGSKNTDYLAYTYTRKGTPLDVVMPLVAGTYELRYILSTGKRILASQIVTVEEVGATLQVPPTANAGSKLDVGWTGPGYGNDYISIATADQGASQYQTYKYTRNGSPAELTLPSAPGEYEVRYILNGSPDVILARTPITLVAVTAELSAPAQADVGSVIDVNWTGPAYGNDFISIAEVGSKVGKYKSYRYARHGDPAELEMPSLPGEYELRYILNGKPDRLLASRPITLVDVTATVSAPPTVKAGEKFEVTWTGPANAKDYVGIGKLNDKKYVTYAYTRNGSPAVIKAPDEPGEYELRYFLNVDRRIIGTSLITVE